MFEPLEFDFQALKIGVEAISSFLASRVTDLPAAGAPRPPRLCILSQYFKPEMGAPQGRLSDLGERLIDLGWEVDALTALPNYPTGRIFDGYDPHEPVIEQIGRIRTVRVPLYTAQRGLAKRLRSYFSFVYSARRHGPRLCRRPDLLFVESPPLFIGYAARYLSRIWGCPYVFNVADLWPEVLIRIGIIKPGLVTWLTQRLELKLYRHAAGVTCQSGGILESITARSPGTRTALVSNGVDPARFGKHIASDAARELIGSEPGPVCVFAGLLGLATGLDQILDIAKALPVEVPGRFVLVGDGPERARLAERIRAEGISRVKLVPMQPREQIPAILAVADMVISTLGTSIPGAIPIKIYEAMGAALPILLIADGEPARLVREADCGLIVPPNDLPAAVNAATRLFVDGQLRQRLGAAGRRAAETVYDCSLIATRLDTFLRGFLSNNKKPSKATGSAFQAAEA